MDAGSSSSITMRLSDTAEAPKAAPVFAPGASGADSPIDAALDAALGLPNPGTAAAAAPTPTTLDRPQQGEEATTITPSSKLGSSNPMSINLDSKVLPTGNQAADKQNSSSSSSDYGRGSSSSSKGPTVTGVRGSSSGGGGGSPARALDFRPGSITMQQVAGEAGKQALQLLEVLVRVAVFVVKYTLKAFIWLVKLIGQYVSNTN